MIHERALVYYLMADTSENGRFYRWQQTPIYTTLCNLSAVYVKGKSCCSPGT